MLRTIRNWLIAPCRQDRRKPNARLAVTQLEARENPATPIGLTDFSSLLGTYGYSPGFSETHNIGRSETKSVTVDQVGSGSTGTFTVTIDATSSATDTASGSSSGNGYGSPITATGSLSEQAVAHKAISGSYSNGTFTITGMTYTETGSWSVAQSTTTVFPQMSSQQRRDTNSTSNYALSWSAAVGTYGQLEYTSFDYTTAETGHDRWRSDWSSPNGSGYSDFITDTAYTVHTTGSGWLATVTGTDTATSTMAGAYTNPDGTGYSYSNTYTQNNPVPSTVYLGMPYQSTSGWTWKAGTPDAINFSFHGTTTDNSTLTESLTATSGYGGTTIDVNSFASTSHATDSGHVVNDEPATPASGTELYHRDELFASATDVTGSGSYISGSANADYHAVETANFAVANTYAVSNDTSTGTDDDGNAYSLTFNYASQSNGSGSLTNTHDYHDSGAGLTLTGTAIGFVGSSAHTSHSWGIRNGTTFDDPTSTLTDAVNSRSHSG